ncbi:MAG: N-acetylmannosamine-6-phosphate 2-epimerase [Candidatus Merdivicinus sp.]|jgi:N-acylglucosamine-6-phosphate 2-epimerase
MKHTEIFDQLKGHLIVSCQALPDEPLHSSYIMSRMAFAAFEGGAKGIRSNSVEDIKAIKETVALPVIGLIKKVYEGVGADVYITPTEAEVDALAESGCDIIAMDATKRVRANGMTISEYFPLIRKKYPDALFMADCSTYEEGMEAQRLGFDCVGTTLSGYTPYTRGRSLPDFEMMERLARDLTIPLIAEGGIWTPEQLQKALATGAAAAVVGTAITRPRDITKRFVAAIEK